MHIETRFGLTQNSKAQQVFMEEVNMESSSLEPVIYNVQVLKDLIGKK